MCLWRGKLFIEGRNLCTKEQGNYCVDFIASLHRLKCFCSFSKELLLDLIVGGIVHLFLDRNQIQQLLSHFTRCAVLLLPTILVRKNLKLVCVRFFKKNSFCGLVLKSEKLHKNVIITNKGSNQFFILNSLIFYFSNQTHRVRWPRRPWAHPHPTEECTRLCLAQLPWGPPALFTLPSARWVRPWTAWHHPSPSSARQWAPTPWTRPAWATVQVSARRWGLWQTHKYADGYTRFRKYIHRKCIFRHCVFKVISLLWQHRVNINNIYFSNFGRHLRIDDIWLVRIWAVKLVQSLN